MRETAAATRKEGVAYIVPLVVVSRVYSLYDGHRIRQIKATDDDRTASARPAAEIDQREFRQNEIRAA